MLALIRFHVLGAAALAQRNVLATLAAVVLALVFVPDAPRALRQVALALTADGAPRLPALVVALVAVLLAARAAPTLRYGLGGWIGSLPLHHSQHRRAIAVALVVPLAPLLVAAALSFVLTPLLLHRPLTGAAIVAVGIGALAAGAAAIPVRRGIVARPLAFAAAILWVAGTWAAIAGSAGLLLLWDLVAGPVRLPVRASERRHLADRWIGIVLTWRALRFRLLGPLLVSSVFLGAAWFYRVNNHLSVREAGFGTRLATLAAVGYGLAMLGNGLVARRRPWPWVRSLPSSSAARVIEDAIAMSVTGLVTLLATSLLDWRAAAVGLATLPTLALLAVGTLRQSGGRLLRLSGTLFWRGALVVGVVTVWPVLSIAALAFAPLALALAARADRRLIVTAWEPLHHDAAGDTMADAVR